MDLKSFLEKLEQSQEYIQISEAGYIKLSEIAEVEEKIFSTDEGKEYKRIILKMKDNRHIISPISAMKQLKAIIDDNPNITAFKVVKTGSGLSTAYSVIPEINPTK